MAETLVAKSTKASVDASTAMVAPQVSHLILGEDVGACDPLTLKADGKLYKASGAAVNRDARVIGFSPRTAKAGQTTTPLGLGTVMKYSDGGVFAPGDLLYLGTGGILSSTASVGDTVGIAQAIDQYNIRVTRAI